MSGAGPVNPSSFSPSTPPPSSVAQQAQQYLNTAQAMITQIQNELLDVANGSVSAATAAPIIFQLLSYVGNAVGSASLIMNDNKGQFTSNQLSALSTLTTQLGYFPTTENGVADGLQSLTAIMGCMADYDGLQGNISTLIQAITNSQ